MQYLLSIIDYGLILNVFMGIVFSFLVFSMVALIFNLIKRILHYKKITGKPEKEIGWNNIIGHTVIGRDGLPIAWFRDSKLSRKFSTETNKEDTHQVIPNHVFYYK